MTKPAHLKGTLFTLSVCTILLAPTNARAQGKPKSLTPASPQAAPSRDSAAQKGLASLSDSLTGSGKDDYETGKLLYSDGDFAGATLKFQHAYDASSDPRLLWNLAAAEKSQRHYARVESLLKQYVRLSGDRLTDTERADATALLDTLNEFIADVTIVANEPGAAVSVDGVPVGTTPLPARLRLDMGDRRIRVDKPGFKPFEVTRTLIGRGSFEVAAALTPDVHEGNLRVTAQNDGTIRVDGKIMGTGSFETTLPSGVHHVVVTAPGRHPFNSDVAVKDGQTNALRVELERVVIPFVEPPPPNRTWAWVSGGVLAIAGLGIGGYFLFKPSKQGPPAPVEGTLDTVELPLRF
jgi:PEGA domain